MPKPFKPRCAALVMALLMCLLAAFPAHADKATAESLFQEGKRLMDAGKTEEACPKFQASMDAEPSVGAMLNLARCHELLGRTASAWAEYTEAANMARRSGQKEREEGATKLATKLEPKLSRLTIEVQDSSEGLVVTRGDQEVPAGSFGTAVPVDPGDYEVRASAPGKQAWSASVTIGAGGDSQTVTVPALAAGSAGGASGDGSSDSGGGGLNGMHVAGIALMGLGVVGIVVGAAFGGIALGESNELDDQWVAGGSMTNAAGEKVGCVNDEGKSCREQADSIATKAHVSTAGFVIGGVALVGGLVLLLAAPSDDDAESARLIPVVGPDNAGLVFTGRF